MGGGHRYDLTSWWRLRVLRTLHFIRAAALLEPHGTCAYRCFVFYRTDHADGCTYFDVAIARSVPRQCQQRLMNETPLYPLRFAPIYQYRLWGGRRLAKLLSAPLPGDDPIGEAWLLSDRDDQASVVADGPLEGKTVSQLLRQYPRQMLGNLSGHFSRFPL